ncbi:hypothetical protein [Helicobacter sp. 23-1045]
MLFAESRKKNAESIAESGKFFAESNKNAESIAIFMLQNLDSANFKKFAESGVKIAESTIEVLVVSLRSQILRIAVLLCTKFFPLRGNRTNGLWLLRFARKSYGLTKQWEKLRVNRIPKDKLQVA